MPIEKLLAETCQAWFREQAKEKAQTTGANSDKGKDIDEM